MQALGRSRWGTDLAGIGAMHERRAVKAFIVTTGDFTLPPRASGPKESPSSSGMVECSPNSHLGQRINRELPITNDSLRIAYAQLPGHVLGQFGRGQHRALAERVP